MGGGVPFILLLMVHYLHNWYNFCSFFRNFIRKHQCRIYNFCLYNTVLRCLNVTEMFLFICSYVRSNCYFTIINFSIAQSNCYFLTFWALMYILEAFFWPEKVIVCKSIIFYLLLFYFTKSVLVIIFKESGMIRGFSWFMREGLTGVGLLCMDTLSCIHGVGRWHW